VEPLANTVLATTRLDTDVYALAAYDACWCAVLPRAIRSSGGRGQPSKAESSGTTALQLHARVELRFHELLL
jgi:hypothetical protein